MNLKSQLTKTEKKIFNYIVTTGYGPKTLAYIFEVTPQAIKKHITSMLKKTEYDTTLEMVVAYYYKKKRK